MFQAKSKLARTILKLTPDVPVYIIGKQVFELGSNFFVKALSERTEMTERDILEIWNCVEYMEPADYITHGHVPEGLLDSTDHKILIMIAECKELLSKCTYTDEWDKFDERLLECENFLKRNEFDTTPMEFEIASYAKKWETRWITKEDGARGEGGKVLPFEPKKR